jgi:TRAP-type C4-dicarboxylate transport system permease small subunit
MAYFEAVLKWIEALCQHVAAGIILAIMFIVFSDVLMRYVANSPISWAYDVINLYLMAGLYFLALSYTYAAHAHIGVDILLHRLPKVGVRLAECLSCLVAIPLFALISKAGFERGHENWANGDVVSGPIAWPTWIGPAVMAVGAGLMVARLGFRLVGNLASLATGRSVVSMPDLGTGIGAE